MKRHMKRRHLGYGVLIFIAAAVVYFTGVKVVAFGTSQAPAGGTNAQLAPSQAQPQPNAGYNNQTGTSSGATQAPDSGRPADMPIDDQPRKYERPITSEDVRPTYRLPPQNTPPPSSDR